jgi:hypothetical protein
MKINKGYILAGLIIAFSLFFELAAHADEVDQATTITFPADPNSGAGITPRDLFIQVGQY